MEVIKRSQVKEYTDRGYKAIDCHLHSSSSIDNLPIEKLTPRYQFGQMADSGFGFVTFTDHNRLDVTVDDDRFVKGVEITFQPDELWDYENPHTLHILAYPEVDQFTDLMEFSAYGDLFGFLEYCDSNDIFTALAHPSRPVHGETIDYSYLPQLIDLFPAVEAFNGISTFQNNWLVLDYCRANSIPVIAGSDSHAGTAEMLTLAHGDSIEEFWENVLQGNSVVVETGLTYERAMHDMQFYIDNVGSIKQRDLKHRKPRASALVKLLNRFPALKGPATTLLKRQGFWIAEKYYFEPQEKAYSQIKESLEV